MRRIPWEEIEKEYVEGIEIDGVRKYPSQTDLCEKYKIASGAIGKKASSDQWRVKREIFASKLREALQTKKIEVISDEGSQFDLDCFNAANIGIRKVVAMVSAAADPDEINKLSTSLKNFQTVGKVALGDNQGEGSFVPVVIVDDLR